MDGLPSTNEDTSGWTVNGQDKVAAGVQLAGFCCQVSMQFFFFSLGNVAMNLRVMGVPQLVDGHPDGLEHVDN